MSRTSFSSTDSPAEVPGDKILMPAGSRYGFMGYANNQTVGVGMPFAFGPFARRAARHLAEFAPLAHNDLREMGRCPAKDAFRQLFLDGEDLDEVAGRLDEEYDTFEHDIEDIPNILGDWCLLRIDGYWALYRRLPERERRQRKVDIRVETIRPIQESFRDWPGLGRS